MGTQTETHDATTNELGRQACGRRIMNWKTFIADSIAFLIAAVSLSPALLFLDLLLNR
jgi:hypothetical protein